MADDASVEPNERRADGLGVDPIVLVRRRYRIQADIVVEVRDITASTVHESIGQAQNYKDIARQQWPWDQARDTRELLRKMIATPELLDRHCKAEVLVEAQDRGIKEMVEDALDVDSSEELELFRPLVKTLSPASRALLEEAIDSGYFAEATDQLFHATSSRIEAVLVADVSEE